MTYPTNNSSFTDLPFGGQFLLWAVRIWASAEPDDDARDDGAIALLRKGFALAGLDRAFCRFDALMAVLSVAAIGPLEIRPRRCRTISADEARLLGLVAAIQRSDPFGALSILEPWTAPTGTRIAMQSATDLANAMSAVNLRLDKRLAFHIHHDRTSGRASVPGGTPGVAWLH